MMTIGMRAGNRCSGFAHSRNLTIGPMVFVVVQNSTHADLQIGGLLIQVQDAAARSSIAMPRDLKTVISRFVRPLPRQ